MILEEGQLPDVGNAIKLSDQLWCSIPKSSLTKCWIESEFLGIIQVILLNSVLKSAADDSTEEIELILNKSVSNLADEEIIGPNDLQDIRESIL